MSWLSIGRAWALHSNGGKLIISVLNKCSAQVLPSFRRSKCYQFAGLRIITVILNQSERAFRDYNSWTTAINFDWIVGKRKYDYYLAWYVWQNESGGRFERKFERFQKRVDGGNGFLPPAFLLFYTSAAGLARNWVSEMKTQCWSRKQPQVLMKMMKILKAFTWVAVV